jgi:hypothetical protein
MRRDAGQTVRQTIEAVLVMLLDRLTAEGTPARVSLYVGRATSAVVLAEAARGCPTPAEAPARLDLPLEASGEAVGFLRFAVGGDAGTTTLREITTTLARDEPRVINLVTGLAYLATLADYFRDADARRGRRSAP